MHHRTAVALAMLACAARAFARCRHAGAVESRASPGIVGALNVSGGADGSIAAAAGNVASAGALSAAGCSLALRCGHEVGVATARGAVRWRVQRHCSARSRGWATASGSANSALSPARLRSQSVSRLAGDTHSATRVESAYATPCTCSFRRANSNAGLFRAAAGVDVESRRRSGSPRGSIRNPTRTEGGPTGTLYGVGISYALRHR